MRLGGAVAAAGEQHLQGMGVRDLPGQADGRAAHREEPAADLEQAEGRRLPGDADVGGLEHLRPTGHADALDRGEDGLARAIPAQHGLPVEVRLGGEPRAIRVVLRESASGECFQIHSGTEGPTRTGQHNGPDGVVGVRFDPCVVQSNEHRYRERVLCLGAVQRQDERRTLPFDDQMFRACHGAASACRSNRIPLRSRTGCSLAGGFSRATSKINSVRSRRSSRRRKPGVLLAPLLLSGHGIQPGRSVRASG